MFSSRSPIEPDYQYQPDNSILYPIHAMQLCSLLTILFKRVPYQVVLQMLPISKENVASRCNQPINRVSSSCFPQREEDRIYYPSIIQRAKFQNFLGSNSRRRTKNKRSTQASNTTLYNSLFSHRSNLYKFKREGKKRRKKTRQRCLEKILQVSLAGK